MFRWRTDLLIVSRSLQSFLQLDTLGNLVQVGGSNLVLCLHPCCCLRTGIVFQPSVRISHLHAEIVIYRTVFHGFRVRNLLGIHTRGYSHCH